jgi:hypothetical protein
VTCLMDEWSGWSRALRVFNGRCKFTEHPRTVGEGSSPKGSSPI